METEKSIEDHSKNCGHLNIRPWYICVPHVPTYIEADTNTTAPAELHPNGHRAGHLRRDGHEVATLTSRTFTNTTNLREGLQGVNKHIVCQQLPALAPHQHWNPSRYVLVVGRSTLQRRCAIARPTSGQNVIWSTQKN